MTAIFKALFFIGDLLLLNFSIMISSHLVNDGANSPDFRTAYLIIFSNIAWLFLVLVSTPYDVAKGWSIPRIVRGQLAFLFVHGMVIISLIIFFQKNYPWFQIVLVYSFFIPLFFLYRIGVLYFRNILTREVSFKNYILIGRNELSNELRRYFLVNQDTRYKFQGYFADDPNDFNIETIREFCANRHVHEIFYCLPNPNRRELDQLVEFGLNSLIKVKLILESPRIAESLSLDRNDQLPGFNLAPIALDDTRNTLVKRLFDLAFSSTFILLVMSWLTPIIAILIKLDSPGPVFFKQLRSGEGNRPFNCLKFRSMKVNQEADSKQATKDDPRITKLGNFLRKSSIDELPQFFNVFMGTMSIVGPRPHMLKHTEEYSKLIEKFMGRQYVKPGITGLAQCMGYRGETKDLADMENRVRLDRYYIENWTFWLDIKIIFLTVVSLIRGSDKAY